MYTTETCCRPSNSCACYTVLDMHQYTSVKPQVVGAEGCAYGGRLPAGPCIPAFHETPKHVWVRLEKKWLARLISTPEFIDWD